MSAVIGIFFTLQKLFSGWQKWPWKLIGCIAAAVFILACVYFFGQSRYDAGFAASDAQWRQHGERVRVQIRAVAHQVVVEHTRVVTRIEAAHTLARSQLQEAANADDLSYLRAWANADRGLLDSAHSASGDSRV